jgi:superfamily II DNA or RNA helicase
MPFAAGHAAFDVNNPGRGAGRLTGRQKTRAAVVFWEVAFGPNERRFIAEEFLQAFDDHDSSVEGLVRRGIFGKADDLRRLLTFEKLKGTLHDFIYSMEAARIDFLEYQFKPVLAFINSPTERLLIADEVGLGKTIEAALIWLELQARRDARRLLVVCPKMLAPKWRMELRHKFGIQAEVGNVDRMQQALADVRHEGEACSFAWICTYSGLRPARRDLTLLDDPEVEDLSERGRLCSVFQNWESNYPLFDLAIFDEAHHMRNPAATTFRLGSAVASATNALLLVSATPVNNTSTDLFTLLRLLDPDFFSNETVFNQLLDENRPALQASLALGQSNFVQAAEALSRLRQSPFVGNSELLRQAIEQIQTLKPGDHAGHLTVLETIEKLNIVSRYVSRTRRVQVKERRPVRKPMILRVEFNDQEMRFYRTVTRMVRRRVEAAGGGFLALHLILPQQRTASCIPAMVQAVRNGDLGDPDELLHEAFDLELDADEEMTPESFDEDVAGWLTEYDFEANDSKFCALKKLLVEQVADEKVIIFAYFKATLRYLQRRLRAEGIGCALIHGDLDDDERAVALESFREKPEVRVLLSSEVGSEGIDLQFCRVIVNYDLPWNPMRVEQRIGRIDRVGQRAERLSIVHFKVKDTVEERLYDKLHSKLRVFEESIGELEPVLGEEIQHLTLELLSRDLSPEEEETVIERTRMAIENKRRLVADLEAEGENLLAHADYIASQVNRNRSLGRYITAHELKSYIADFFNRSYKGCALQWDWPKPDCFTLELTHSAHDQLRDFIRNQRLKAPVELHSRKITATLSPAVAQTTRLPQASQSLLLITHQSPLVKWITDENLRAENVFFGLSAMRLRSGEWSPGVYAYRVERWKFTGLRSREHLAYGVAHLTDGSLLDPDAAERFFQSVTKDAKTWHEPKLEPETVLSTFKLIDEGLHRRFEQIHKQYVAENADTLAIHTAQVKSHFQRRVAANQQRIVTLRMRGRAGNMVALVEANIEKDRLRLEEKLRGLTEKARTGSDFSEVASGIVEVQT